MLREASANDRDAIVSLINRAFAVESFFKSGPRINPEMLEQMMQDGRFLLLSDKNEILACVFVKVTGERGYLGTLSVDPGRQKSGLGTRMMREAEDYFRAAGCNVVDIRNRQRKAGAAGDLSQVRLRRNRDRVGRGDPERHASGSLRYYVEGAVARRRRLARKSYK